MEKEVIYLRNEARNSFAVQEAAAWFSSKWDVPEDAYKESIAQCIEKVGAVPQWYIMRNKEGQVVAGGSAAITPTAYSSKPMTRSMPYSFI